MSTKEILIAARKLIEKEENWTQKSYARDRKGEQVGLFGKDAYSFCIGGAIQKALGMDLSFYQFWADEYLNKINIERDPIIQPLFQLGFQDFSLISFNDNHTHKELLEFLDKAIACI